MSGIGHRWVGIFWSVAVVSLASAVGCGTKSSNCEFEVNGATVCLVEEFTFASCDDAAGGIPHDPADTTCPDLGYPVACDGFVPLDGPEGYDGVRSNSAYASTEEDCAAAVAE